MPFSSLWGGRSRSASTTQRPRRNSAVPARSRRKDDAEDGKASFSPGIEELRRQTDPHRAGRLEQRRQPSTTSSTKDFSTVSTASRTTGERRQKRARNQSGTSSGRSGTSRSGESSRRREREQRGGDYAYSRRSRRSNADHMPTRAASYPLEARDGNEDIPAAGLVSASSGGVYRRSLRSLPEEDVAPDDSISQVAERPHRRSRAEKHSSRPGLKRSSSATLRKLRAVREEPIDQAPAPTLLRSSKREPSFSSPSTRRHSTPSVPAPVSLVDCLTCGSDDIPSTKSAKLECGHRMCHDCLKRIFNLSVKDPVHMPPKCCTDQHIPLKHVDRLFDIKFKKLWNDKYQEYHASNRIYCPSPNCGEWIKPSATHINTDSAGRKYALCPRCKTKVCSLCNNKLHKSRDCPKDPEIAKLVEQAKQEGWQRCFSCNAIVEKQEGCNHMTCRCRAEFCMICGAQWKTCDCPWFNYNDLPMRDGDDAGDRLNDMRVPEPINVVLRQVFRAVADRQQPQDPHDPGAAAAARAPRAGARAGRNERPAGPAVTYRQELEARRRQELMDAALAHRLHLALLLGYESADDESPPPRRRRATSPSVFGTGNNAGHFMNDNFVQNASNVVMDAFGDPSLGRRGDRASGRLRRSRRPTAATPDQDAGLAPNFLGDESVLGIPNSAGRRA